MPRTVPTETRGVSLRLQPSEFGGVELTVVVAPGAPNGIRVLPVQLSKIGVACLVSAMERIVKDAEHPSSPEKAQETNLEQAVRLNGRDSAAPHNFPTGSSVPFVTLSTGLTKREWLSGLAMQGLLASSLFDPALPTTGLTEMAVACADNLLAELAKETPADA